MGTLITVVGWLAASCVAAMIGEVLFALTDMVNKDRDLKPAAVFWFVLLGFGGGLASAATISFRILPAPPFHGVSLVALPVLLGTFMWWLDAARKGRGTHLATWYGGAAFGLGLAAGRLVGLAFAAEVASV